jgi:hypothetical protein
MTFKRIPHKSGKGWIRVGRPNAREWLAWLEKTNANGVAKNHQGSRGRACREVRPINAPPATPCRVVSPGPR